MSRHTTVPVVNRHVRRLLTPERLADIRCRANSGIADPRETVLLLEHIELVQEAFVQRERRVEVFGDD